MEYTLTQSDIEFMKWLDSKECEHYWEKDEKGEKVILRSGWDRAQAEYNRMNGLEEKSRKRLKGLTRNLEYEPNC